MSSKTNSSLREMVLMAHRISSNSILTRARTIVDLLFLLGFFGTRQTSRKPVPSIAGEIWSPSSVSNTLYGLHSLNSSQNHFGFL
jgi:hypothetical protein